MIKGMQEVIDVMTKAKADLDKNGGLKQVIFVACGVQHFEVIAHYIQ